MDNSDVIAALDRLADLRAHIDALNLRYDAEREKALKPVQVMLDQIESARIEDTGQLRAEAGELESAIRAEVLSRGKSIKGEHISAVYTKGRTTWDSKALTGYAAAHPELEEFKNIGEPSVAIKNR